MNSIESHLNLALLEKVRYLGNKVVARCPACSETGGDRRGDHLAILPNGKFACAACPGDTEHRKRIFALVGILGNQQTDPVQQMEWKQQKNRERFAELDRRKIVSTAKAKRNAIIARYRWPEYDVWEQSPQRIDTEEKESNPSWFLRSLFPADALLWTGEVKESGINGHYKDRWRTCEKWGDLTIDTRIGPMTTPAVWKPDSHSRSGEQVLSSPYTVLDFDGIDGKKPETPEQLQQHLIDSLAIIRWIYEGLHWSLAAIVWTGSKSLHAWFHNPGQSILETLRTTAHSLGLDAGLIGHPEHPCRLPGQKHAKTGQYSRVLWLQLPPLE